MPSEEKRRQAKMRGCFMTVDERVTAAAASKWYVLEIPFWWTKKDGDSWQQWAFQKLTRIIIKWRDASAILQQDDANTAPTALAAGHYILDHFIRFDVTVPSEATKQEYLKRVSANGSNGWLHLVGQTERLTESLSASATSHVIQLNTFTKFGYNMRFVIRPTANLTPNYLNNRRFEYWTITSATFSIAGKQFLPVTDSTYLKYEVNDWLFDSHPEYNIWNIPFNKNPDLHSAAMGGFEFFGASTPQLTLVTPALPAAAQLDIYLYVHNYVRLTIQGNSVGAELVQDL
jgi:hypothetical protein